MLRPFFIFALALAIAPPAGAQLMPGCDEQTSGLCEDGDNLDGSDYESIRERLDVLDGCADVEVVGGSAGAPGLECQTDDDVPESGDFGAAQDLNANGSVAQNAVALSVDTTGNYVTNVADSGAGEITVGGSPAEGWTPQLGIAASIARDSELHALTVTTTNLTDPGTACEDGDVYVDTDAIEVCFCIDGAADNWACAALTD